MPGLHMDRKICTGWLDDNEAVNFSGVDFVNDPGFISQLKNFVAVNTAIQVDLYGQANATFGPNGRVSSPGGQVEFMFGAHRSFRGKSIFAIRSTAKNQTISTISLHFMVR